VVELVVDVVVSAAAPEQATTMVARRMLRTRLIWDL